MVAPAALIVAWARSAVAGMGGAFAHMEPHEIAAPVVQALLTRAELPASAVDAVLVGNALGAGGNPARLVSLAAGLPETTPAFSIDSQCCAGLDAISLGAAMIAAGQARIVVAGGVEAWSRAPIRQRKPHKAGAPAHPYERPPFAPEPHRDPDVLQAAAQYAQATGHTRAAQDAYARHSHGLCVASRLATAAEIVPIAGLGLDSYPREMGADRAARLPALARDAANGRSDRDCSIGLLGIAPKADGAGFVVMAEANSCSRLGLRRRAEWLRCVHLGTAPEMPLLAAGKAAALALARTRLRSDELFAVELHDAFAVQGLQFREFLRLDPSRLNRHGGGLARGHPIGASGAITLVRLLADLSAEGRSGDHGLAAIAAAGGIGSAAIVRRC